MSSRHLRPALLLWPLILARDPALDEAVVSDLEDRADALGFPVAELIRVRH